MQSIIITITIITMIIIINLGGRRGKLVLEKSSWIWLASTSPFEDLVHLVEINNKKEKQINSSLFEDQIPFEDLVHLVNIWRI